MALLDSSRYTTVPDHGAEDHHHDPESHAKVHEGDDGEHNEQRDAEDREKHHRNTPLRARRPERQQQVDQVGAVDGAVSVHVLPCVAGWRG